MIGRPRVVAMDLDGTILADGVFPALGDPLPGIREELETLKQLGWVISIWTCRGPIHYEAIKEHLTSHGIPFDYLNENPHEIKQGSPKMYADVYVDDRGLQFEGDPKGLAARVLSHRPWHKMGMTNGGEWIE